MKISLVFDLRTFIGSVALAVMALSASQSSAQQPYPNKPVHIVNNFQAGGPTDILARIMSDSLQKELKQPFVVDNKVGASGNVGADAVAKSPADGYTVLFSIDTVFTTNPTLYPAMPFKPEDFKVVMLMTASGLLFGVNPALGVKTVPEFIARGKAGNLNFSSAGNGTPAHIAMALLADASGIKATQIPYKGTAPAVQALVAGEVDAGIIITPGLLPQVQGGKVQALAVTGQRRAPMLPNVPTVAEVGLKGVEFEAMQIAMVPAATPDSVVQTLQAAMLKTLQQPDIKARLEGLDMMVIAETGKLAADHLAANRVRYAKIIQSAGIKPD